MSNAAQSWATGPLFFLKTGCPNEIVVASGNRATTNFKHWVVHKSDLTAVFFLDFFFAV